MVLIPIAKGSYHRYYGVRSPGADEQEEDREGNFGDSHLDASLFVLVAQRLDVHLLGLKTEKINLSDCTGLTSYDRKGTYLIT